MSTPDQLRVAELHGHALYCVHHRVPAEQAAASLREISVRPDLLAQAAGVIIGASKRDLGDWPVRRAAARALIDAGADRGLLPAWVARGRENLLRGVRGARLDLPEDLDVLLAETLTDPEAPATATPGEPSLRPPATERSEKSGKVSKTSALP